MLKQQFEMIITLDDTNYAIKYRKGQHLSLEEWYEIQTRLKDKWSTYKIAKGRDHPYNIHQKNRST